MLSFDELAREFPEQIWIEIYEEDEENALPNEQDYSNDAARLNAYLSCLCLNLLLAWFQEEEEGVQPLPFPKRNELSSVWEFVNATAIDFGKARFVIIPNDGINTDEFIIPGEWVDIPSWRGNYYLAVQINCEDGWLRVLGYATHKQIKNEGEYDEVNRSYLLEREDLVEDLNIIFVMEDLDENELENNVENLDNLPTLSSAAVTNLVEGLSQNNIYLPRLEVEDFTRFKALLGNADWREQLYQLRIGNINWKPESNLEKTPVLSSLEDDNKTKFKLVDNLPKLKPLYQIYQTVPTRKSIQSNSGNYTDKLLLIALIILNIGSGFTTMYGAAQIFPRYLGWSFGAVIQALLTLLTSGSSLKHAPLLKWVAVGSFSIISIYSSFFAYYDILVAEAREKDGLNRAISAHKNLVNEVFIPIEEKAQQLENEINIRDKLIKEETNERRSSGLAGCGKICKDLKDERENLQIMLNQVKQVVNKLRPFFEYDLEGKEPEEVFDADRKALAKLQQKCLPTEAEFVCFPEKYNGSLDPLNPKYKELQSKYFDLDARITVIEPFLKIRKGEEAAIAAAFMALLVDGCIILLGIGIEIPPKSKKNC